VARYKPGWRVIVAEPFVSVNVQVPQIVPLAWLIYKVAVPVGIEPSDAVTLTVNVTLVFVDKFVLGEAETDTLYVTDGLFTVI
jgi:hypothetical protein